jgi:acyl-CoA synthetase
MDLLDEMRKRGASGLERLKGFRISGAATPPQVMAELLEHGIVPQSGYGMTETNAHQYTRPGDNASLIMESSGRACDGFEVSTWHEDDPDLALPPGETGQLGVRGASLMLGYFDDQAATEAAFNAHGWFMTGDLGWLDENGYLRITGRGKDVIIRGGNNINPARIEEAAMSHEAVERAAAVPVADARLGERICLAVMYRPGSDMVFDRLLGHLETAGLSRDELPELYLELADIPLMSNGKIEKRVVLKWIADGRVAPMAVNLAVGES